MRAGAARGAITKLRVRSAECKMLCAPQINQSNNQFNKQQNRNQKREGTTNMETVFNNGGGSGSGTAGMGAPRLILPGRAPGVLAKPNIQKHVTMFSKDEERAGALVTAPYENGLG